MAAKPKQRPKGRYPTKLTTHNRPVIAYLTPEQVAGLDRLAKATRVPKSVFLREAVDDLLRKYSRKGGKP